MYAMVLTELILSFLSNLDLLIDGILLFFLDIEHGIPELLVQE